MNYTEYRDLMYRVTFELEIKRDKLEEYSKKANANPYVIKELNAFYDLIETFAKDSAKVLVDADLAGKRKNQDQLNKWSGNKEQLRADHFWKTFKKWEDHY